MIISLLSNWLDIGFVLLSGFTLYFFYRATGRPAWVLMAGCVWLLLTAVLAVRGVFLDNDALPPPLAYAMVPMLLVGLYLGFSNHSQPIRERINMEGLHYLHAVRIPVEVVFLKGLADRGSVAPELTYEGYNYDLAMGFLLPLTGLLVFRLRWLSTRWAVAANLVGIGVLAWTVAVAVLSAPSPFQRFGFGQPTVAILQFPYVWLPALVAPLMFWAHFIALGRMRGNRL